MGKQLCEHRNVRGEHMPCTAPCIQLVLYGWETCPRGGKSLPVAHANVTAAHTAFSKACRRNMRYNEGTPLFLAGKDVEYALEALDAAIARRKELEAQQ